MDLHEATDRLYAGAPEDFVATRATLVKAARADGERELAGAIAALRRPTAAAGLLNSLSREDPEAVSALCRIGDELRAAQRAGDGAGIRTLGATRRRLIASTMSAVDALARDRAQTLSDAVRADVESSLAAAILDPASADALVAGTLTGALQQVGFGDWSSAARLDGDPQSGRPVLHAVPDLPTPAGSKGPSRAEQNAEREHSDRARATSRHATALARAEKATAGLEAAQDRAAAAQQRVERVQEQIDQLRGELAIATADARQAHEAQRKAARDASAAMRRLAPGAD